MILGNVYNRDRVSIVQTAYRILGFSSEIIRLVAEGVSRREPLQHYNPTRAFWTAGIACNRRNCVYGRHQLGRYCLDYRRHRISADDDAGAGILLRRDGAP